MTSDSVPGPSPGPQGPPAPLESGTPAAQAPQSPPPSPGTPGPRQDWTAHVRKFVDQGSKITNLDPVTFVPITIGLAALALLLLSTLFSWYSYYLQQKGLPLQGEFFRGISYTEGKWVFVVGIPAGVWLLLGLVKKSWLPAGLLASGAAGTFATVLLWALRMRLNAFWADAVEQMKPSFEMSKNFGLDPNYWGGVGWALNFALLFAMAIAVAFLIASFRMPQSLAYLQKPNLSPFVQKFGFVGAVHAGALLVGIIVAVILYQ